MLEFLERPLGKLAAFGLAMVCLAVPFCVHVHQVEETRKTTDFALRGAYVAPHSALATLVEPSRDIFDNVMEAGTQCVVGRGDEVTVTGHDPTFGRLVKVGKVEDYGREARATREP